MSKLLVTGGAGFIGSNFVHYWLERYPKDRVVVLDALTYAGNLANLEAVESDARFSFVLGGIGDEPLTEDILREEGIDTIVNFAAESHVDRSISGPDEFIQTNVVGTHNLLKTARKVWLTQNRRDEHRFHHISTDEVYGSLPPEGAPFAETTPYAPNSPYSASKAASDHLVRAYHHTYGLNVTTSNCSNNYGPYHFPEKLIPLVIVNILQGRKLPIYGDGKYVRDWLHVSDHCRGIELILKKGIPGETYNIGGNAECDNLSLVNMLCEIADEMFAASASLREKFRRSSPGGQKKASSLIEFVTDRPGHDRRYAIDCTKISRELGFAPTVTLYDGLKATFEWYVENEAWWRAVVDGSYREWVRAQYPTASQLS